MLTSEFCLTDAEKALLPTDEDVAAYARHGWWLSGKVLTDAEADELTAASEAFYRGARDRRLPCRPRTLAYWEPAHGDVQRHNDYIAYECQPIAGILSKPVISAIAGRLAQATQIRLFQSTLIYKPPKPDEPTNLVPWHFDRHYWQTCTSERMLTAFIPFHDCDQAMGTITIVDGSHLWRETGATDGTTRHFAERDPGELEKLLQDNARHNRCEIRKVPMIIPKGHMSFHHSRVYHGSGANLSGRPRRAISLHLQDGENRYRPCTRSDGTKVEYNHDHLVRRSPGGTPDYSDPRFCPVLWRQDAIADKGAAR